MLKLSIRFLIPLLLTAPVSGVAQLLSSCASSRVAASSRSAVVSPEHQRLMNQYDVTFYKLDLQLERNSTFIAGTVTINAQAKADGLRVFAFELHPNFTIQAITVNGQPQQTITRGGNEVSVPLSAAVPAAGALSAEITYRGTAPSGASAAIGNGFNTAKEPTWGNQVTWSLSEPYAAYEWWPTKQVLTDKADSVQVFVTTSAENRVGSNGVLANTVNLPDGRVRYEWKSRYPIDYYLISVAVSNYEEYVTYANPKGAPAPIPIVNYVYQGGALSRFRDEMDLTGPFIENFSELFTRYPFAAEKYGHSMAPIGGGMEHQTMTTQSTFEFTLTAHELAHQWFGDNVTCASWEDIWLNEGFASYSEYLSLQKFRPEQADEWIANAHAFAFQRPQGSVHVTDTANVSRIFDYRLTYKKGASVIHMLRFALNNDTLFFRALQNYQQQFRYGTASTKDLQRVFEETSNLQLGYFFDQWYNGYGFPQLSVEWNQQGNTLLLRANQTPSGPTPFFKTDVEYLVHTTAGDKLFRLLQGQPNEAYVLQVAGQVTGIEVDPNNWLLQQTIQNQQNTALAVPRSAKPLLYPNPADAAVTVAQLNFIPATAEIYDAVGRLVKRVQLLQQPEPSINVQDLPGGLYILQLHNGDQHAHCSFVKLKVP